MQTPNILQMLSGQTTGPSPLGQIKQMIGAVKAAGNPQAFMQQMLRQSNPQLMEALELVRRHGGDAHAAFAELAREYAEMNGPAGARGGEVYRLHIRMQSQTRKAKGGKHNGNGKRRTFRGRCSPAEQ